MLSAVFHHAVDAGQTGKGVFHLVGLAVSFHLEQTVARGAYQHVTILPFQQTGDVTRNVSSFYIIGSNRTETLTIKNLQCTVHTDKETAVMILRHTVDVVAGHTKVLAHLLFIYTELITIVTIQTVTGGNPDKTVFIQIDLCGVAARHLFVCIEELSHLSISTKAVHQA